MNVISFTIGLNESAAPSLATLASLLIEVVEHHFGQAFLAILRHNNQMVLQRKYAVI
jgi:hypothetical protein